MLLPLPPSVFAYLTDRSFRTGIDHLVEAGPLKWVPEDLEWPELQDYYRAAGAAARVMTDFAEIYDRMWSAVWEPHLVGWAPLDPYDCGAGEWNFDLTIEGVWEQGAARVSANAGATRELATTAWFNERHVGIGFGLRRLTGKGAFLKLQLGGFSPEEKMLESKQPLALDGEAINLSPAIAEARRAAEYLQSMAG